MKSFRKELWFEVSQRRALLNITPQVEQCLLESGIREGLCLVNATLSPTALDHLKARAGIG